MSALVLKRFTVNRDAQPGEDCVCVIGRQAGLIAFILSIMNVDPLTKLKCSDERIQVVTSSFFGQQSMTIPTAAIAGIVGGYQKPKALLVAICLVLVASGAMSGGAESVIPFAVGLGISLVLFVAYILNKEMSLFVQNGGDHMWGLKFKRSVIENVPVDVASVNEAVALINSKVLAARRE